MANTITPPLLNPSKASPSCSFHLLQSSKPPKLASSLAPHFFQLRTKTYFPSFSAFVAHTAGWAPEDEKDLEGDEILGQGGIFEETQELGWEGEGEDSSFGVSNAGADEGFGSEETDEEGKGDSSYVEPPEEAKVYVGNLPFDVDSEKLAMLFEKAGTVEIAEVIYNRETDLSRGFGFVSMSNVQEAEKAVGMFHRYELDGRLLTVNRANPRGLKPDRIPRVFDSGFRVYAGNLPWDVDSARLEQIFSKHGKVLNARVVYDRDSGRSRGFGFVTMTSEAGMNEAIAALDGQNVDGRSIKVNAAEERPKRGFF
ncbi:hypothetical protein MLD38_026098 [Melastoma candidum]|nr:hypothetical protein MLD38_026098 [Melastoma candidum]